MPRRLLLALVATLAVPGAFAQQAAACTEDPVGAEDAAWVQDVEADDWSWAELDDEGAEATLRATPVVDEDDPSCTDEDGAATGETGDGPATAEDPAAADEPASGAVLADLTTLVARTGDAMTTTFAMPAAGVVKQRLVSPKGVAARTAKRTTRVKLLGTARLTVTKAGTARVRLRLSAAGRRAVRQATKAMALRLETTVTLADGTTSARTTSVTLKPRRAKKA